MIAEHFTRRWQRAGLIDEPLAHRILEWEATHRKPVVLWAIAGMGVLAVSLGVMAIVGANWEDIPARLKLGVCLAVNAAAAAAVWLSWRRDRTWLREGFALLLFGLVLGGIALIGQVYQLQSAPWHALALWLVLCTPFFAMTSFSRLSGVVWAIAVVTTWFTADSAIADALAAAGALPRTREYGQSEYLIPVMSYAIACLMIVLSEARGSWVPSRGQASLMLKLSLAGLIGTCSLIACFSRSLSGTFMFVGPLAVSLAVTVPAALALWLGRIDLDRRVMLGFLIGSFAVWAIGLALLGRSDTAADLSRALLFILYWGAIGALAARSGWRGWFGFAFTMIGLRLLILYFEAIGGLTATGFGLIGGGVLCLVLAALGWRLTRGVGRAAAAA